MQRTYRCDLVPLRPRPSPAFEVRWSRHRRGTGAPEHGQTGVGGDQACVATLNAPDSISIIGCDAANGTYFKLYSDERGVCRIYEMSISDGGWTLWREGEQFSQWFTARISDDGNTLTGRWEIAEDFTKYETDFEPIYHTLPGVHRDETLKEVELASKYRNDDTAGFKTPS